MVRIIYDDREKFPWVVWVGKLQWCKCRTHRGAVLNKSRIEELLEAAEAAGGK